MQETRDRSDTDEYDEIVKIIVIGDSGVGKSSIVTAYCDNICPLSHSPTIGVEYRTKIIKLKGKRVKLTIWDTAGLERFRSITSSYYRGANAVLIVFDITNPYSLCNIDTWLTEIKDHMSPNTPFIVVGNKCEHHAHTVTDDLRVGFSARYNTSIYPVSALVNTGIDQVMNELAARYLNNRTQTQVILKSVRSESITKPRDQNRCCLL
ncbi:Ras family GTPase [uncultured virus]|nr:Ras family GTPase [uncultured virus]